MINFQQPDFCWDGQQEWKWDKVISWNQVAVISISEMSNPFQVQNCTREIQGHDAEFGRIYMEIGAAYLQESLTYPQSQKNSITVLLALSLLHLKVELRYKCFLILK